MRYNSKWNSNMAKIQRTSNDQYTITIPRALAEALNLTKGSCIEYKIDGPNQFILHKVDSAQKSAHVKIQVTSGNQHIITIPKIFAESLGFTQGTIVTFQINQNMDLIMQKK